MKNPERRARLALGICLVLGAVGCATTSFQSTWRAPDAGPLDFRGKKVLAVFIGRNESVRRRAEDAMVREIGARGAQGVPSYTILSSDEAKDLEASRRKIDGQGFAGAVAMRVVSRDTEVSYQPGFAMYVGPRYRHFWGGWWGWGWGHIYQPATVRADEVVSVETLVYSFAKDELVWAGTSRTTNPDRVEGLVSELAVAVTKQMEKEGLIGRSRT